MSAGDRVSMERIEGNYMSQLEAMQRSIDELRTDVLNLQKMDSATQDLGDQQANSITYPSFAADEDGIKFPQIGDGIQLTDAVRISSEDVGTNLKAMKVEVFDTNRAIRIETNGDFETGDLTGWTTAGTTTPVATVEDAHGGSYSCKLVGGATAGKINQLITLSASNRAVYAKFRRKASAGIHVRISYLDSSDVELYNELFYFSETVSPGDSFALGTCGIRPTVASGTIAKVNIYFRIESSSASDYAYIDDVEIYESDGTINYTRFLMTYGGWLLQGGYFGLKDGNGFLMEMTPTLLEFYRPVRFNDAVSFNVDKTAFTPVIKGTTVVGVGTYTKQEGYYSRVGNIVFFTIVLQWTAHTGTGDMFIDGLPITAAYAHPCSAWWSNITLPAAGDKLISLVMASTTWVTLYTVGGGALVALALDTAATLRVSGFYFV